MHHIKLNVYLHNLLENVQKIRNVTGQKKLMVVAKANCYGLYSSLIGPALAEHVGYFAVATMFEAIEMRQLCPAVRILLLNEPRQDDIPILAKQNIECSVFKRATLDSILEFLEANPEAKIATHFKINTGCNRFGNQLDLSIREIQIPSSIFMNEDSGISSLTSSVEGSLRKNLLDYWLDISNTRLIRASVWTHLQNAGVFGTNHRMNHLQIQKFEEVTSAAGIQNTDIDRHIANSFCIENYPSSHFDMVRSGLAVYENTFELSVQIKHFFTPEKGTTVGYGCEKSKYVFDGQEQVACLGIGIADGPYLGDHLYKKNGYVIYQQQKCYFASSVMGDITMIRVPADVTIKNEDWVTLISKEGNSDQAMTLNDFVTITEQNPREFLVQLGRRIDRQLIKNQRL